VLHLIRRIGALNRGNIITPRQIESACSARLAHTGHNRHSNDMTKPVLRFPRSPLGSRGMTSNGAARIYDYRSPHCQPHRTAASDPDTDRFELFYWSNVKGRWRHLRKPRPHENSCSRALTRSSRATRCSAFREADKPVQNWPKSSLVVRLTAPIQVRSATVQHRRHGGVNGRGKGRGQGL